MERGCGREAGCNRLVTCCSRRCTPGHECQWGPGGIPTLHSACIPFLLGWEYNKVIVGWEYNKVIVGWEYKVIVGLEYNKVIVGWSITR